jgi:uncharacterized protein (DUF2141 family)
MITPKHSGIVLLVLAITIFSTVSALAQCKHADAEAKVVKSEGNDGKSTIVIEYKDRRDAGKFQVNLFGPDRNNQLSSNKTSFENLTPGKYLIVIVSRKEGDGYCPTSINVTIN